MLADRVIALSAEQEAARLASGKWLALTDLGTGRGQHYAGEHYARTELIAGCGLSLVGRDTLPATGSRRVCRNCVMAWQADAQRVGVPARIALESMRDAELHRVTRLALRVGEEVEVLAGHAERLGMALAESQAQCQAATEVAAMWEKRVREALGVVDRLERFAASVPSGLTAGDMIHNVRTALTEGDRWPDLQREEQDKINLAESTGPTPALEITVNSPK